MLAVAVTEEPVRGDLRSFINERVLKRFKELLDEKRGDYKYAWEGDTTLKLSPSKKFLVTTKSSCQGTYQRGRDDARLIAAHVDKAAFLAAARDVGRSRECRVLFIRERCVEREGRLSHLCCVCGHFSRVLRELRIFRRLQQYYLSPDCVNASLVTLLLLTVK